MKTCLLLFLLPLVCEAGIEEHFRKLEGPRAGPQIPGIDYIYLINLDERPEKLALSMGYLAEHGIYPHRMRAIYGWGLSSDAMSAVGLKFTKDMWRGREAALYFPPAGIEKSFLVNLNESCYGYAFFSTWTTPGAIGCTLSHLSVLQDASDMGYSTIWVMEDDIEVRDEPRRMAQYIEELDALVGEEGWDILYTDYDNLAGVDANRDLLEQLPMKWRPDMPGFDLRPLLEHTQVGPHFAKIGTRHRTHSMVIRQSGVRKILEFYKAHQMFMPYDHEIAFIPGMRFYVLKPAVVSCKEITSDTKHHVFR